jgi:indole-3-glycerol phosphate synthase
MDILKKILDNKKEEIALLKNSFPINQIKEGIVQKNYTTKSLLDSLSKNKVNIIAEIKKASPSKGVILNDFHPLKIAIDYEAGGASAISILTDEKFFQGKIDYLTAIKSVVTLPLLRKDFIIDEYQVYQSKFYGADAILLIGKALSFTKLKDLASIANEEGLDILYEVHDEDDFEKGIELGFKIYGVNNRNLNTFDVDNNNVVKFSKLIPEGSILVSESGILSKEDLDSIVLKGVTNFLIGEYLMKSEDRVGLLKVLLNA